MRGEQEEDNQDGLVPLLTVYKIIAVKMRNTKKEKKRNQEKTTKKRRDCAKGETACTADDRSRLFSTFRDISQLFFPF